MAKAGDGRDRSSKRQRNNILQKRVSDPELAVFVDRAHEAGFADHREYLSVLILGEALIQRTERSAMIRALGELGKHGSNLNQIARALNEDRAKSISVEDMKSIKDARAAVDDIASQIKEALK